MRIARGFFGRRDDCRAAIGTAEERARRQIEEARGADVIDVVPCLLGTRPILAITGNRAVDDLWVDRAHILIAEAEPRHDAGPELLEYDVGARDQRLQFFAVRLALENEAQALLAADK